MSIEIKTLSGRVLYYTAGNAADVREAVVEAASQGANLRDAYLRDAYLRGANLRDANLQGANLRDAYLQGAKNVPGLVVAQLSFLPEGSLIGWKKARGGAIVKLKIPAKARRSHGTGRKCRADRAKVLSITAPDGTTLTEAHSQLDLSFVYRVGETVTPVNGWGEDRWEECAPGIHFYITREEAEAY